MKQIRINGKTFEHEGDNISYEQICTLTGHKPESNPTVIYFGKRSVVTTDGENVTFERDGILTHGRSIPVYDQLKIECCITGNA